MCGESGLARRGSWAVNLDPCLHFLMSHDDQTLPTSYRLALFISRMGLFMILSFLRMSYRSVHPVHLITMQTARGWDHYVWYVSTSMMCLQNAAIMSLCHLAMKAEGTRKSQHIGVMLCFVYLWGFTTDVIFNGSSLKEIVSWLKSWLDQIQRCPRTELVTWC